LRCGRVCGLTVSPARLRLRLRLQGAAAIKMIPLSEVNDVKESDHKKKQFCFLVSTPYRVFYVSRCCLHRNVDSRDRTLDDRC
jgi:hypothetical protein